VSLNDETEDAYWPGFGPIDYLRGDGSRKA
jgi:hypothetical protein